MSRREIRLKGYRWSPFDEDLAAFIRAVREGPGGIGNPEGIIQLSLNPRMLTDALVPARISDPQRFVVALMIECALSQAAMANPVARRDYELSVRPMVVTGTNPPHLDQFTDFLEHIFLRDPPSARKLTLAAQHMALEWAIRFSEIIHPNFSRGVLDRLSHSGPVENPLRTGFEAALREFEQEIRERRDGQE